MWRSTVQSADEKVYMCPFGKRHVPFFVTSLLTESGVTHPCEESHHYRYLASLQRHIR